MLLSKSPPFPGLRGRGAEIYFDGCIILPQILERKFRHNEICLEDYSDEEIRSRYRFRRDSLEFLTKILQNDLLRDTKRNQARSPAPQMLVALVLRHRRSSKSSVSRVVSEVSLALAMKQKELISWPSPLEIQEVKRAFYEFYADVFGYLIPCLYFSLILDAVSQL